MLSIPFYSDQPGENAIHLILTFVFDSETDQHNEMEV